MESVKPIQNALSNSINWVFASGQLWAEQWQEYVGVNRDEDVGWSGFAFEVKKEQSYVKSGRERLFSQRFERITIWIFMANQF